MSSSDLPGKLVLIFKGYYENFKTSLCKALESGLFLWGFRNKSDLDTVLEYKDHPVVFYIVNHGMAMIAKVVDKQVENYEPFWPNEIERNEVIYSYRIYLKPLKISEKLLDVCTKGANPPSEGLVSAREVQIYIAKECGMSVIRATIPLGANVNVVRDCKAIKLLEYLEKNLVPFEIESSSREVKEVSWDPLIECKNFYLEVTGAPYPGHIGKCLWAYDTHQDKDKIEGLEVGDCIIHYLTSKSPSYKSKAVGVSRVIEKYIKLDRNGLIEKLKEAGIWGEDYQDFANEWLNKYNSFYFVKLSGFIEFQNKINIKEIQELTGISPVKLQGRYLVELEREKALEILRYGLGGYTVEQKTRHPTFYTMGTLLGKPLRDEEFIILLNLFSGKNVLLVGPPGSGKTSFLKDLLGELGVAYAIVTGNPEWTHFDTIGGVIPGRSIGEEFVKKGFIYKVIEESVEKLKNGELYWLILDEINRANVDLAFGKFFTLLDPAHREKEKLEIYGHEGVKASITVPFSFRVLATMNNYDRALLFKLGYALTRRFAVINHNYLENLSRYCENYPKKALEGSTLELLIKYSGLPGDFGEFKKIDFEKIRKELAMCRKCREEEPVDNPCDCITPVDFSKKIEEYGDKWIEEVYSLEVPGSSIRLDKILIGLVGEVNAELAKYNDCEICPVQVTPGLVADALKYLAIGVYAYKTTKLKCIEDEVKKLSEEKKLSDEEQAKVRILAYTLLLLDSAFSTYIIPQLDILADYANREKLYRGRPGVVERREKKSIVDVLREIKEEVFERSGLVYSAELIGKLVDGYHVF